MAFLHFLGRIKKYPSNKGSTLLNRIPHANGGFIKFSTFTFNSSHSLGLFLLALRSTTYKKDVKQSYEIPYKFKLLRKKVFPNSVGLGFSHLKIFFYSYNYAVK